MKNVAMLALVAVIGVFAVGCEKKPAANTTTPPKPAPTTPSTTGTTPAAPANPAPSTTPATTGGGH